MKILVTGAAHGIGAAIATRLAREAQSTGGHAELLLVDIDADGLARLADTLRSRGARVECFVGDLADAATPARAVAAAESHFGSLDIVASNAGISIKMKLQDYSVEQYDRILAINTRATWLLGKAAHALLSRSRGCIIATTSISGHHATPMSGPYSASKAALIMLIRQMALEWGPDGIRANSVSPGSVKTSLSPERYATEELRDFVRSTTPLRIIVEPEQVADAVAFLAGNRAVTGVDIVVDGGRVTTLMNPSGMTAKLTVPTAP